MAYMTPQTNKFIFVFAALVIAATALWYAYTLADHHFLPELQGAAVVKGKQYRPLSEKYQIQNVGGRTQTIKLLVPEAWLVDLELEGRPAQAEVSREDYETISEGDRLEVGYKRRRISRSLLITRIAGRVED